MREGRRVHSRRRGLHQRADVWLPSVGEGAFAIGAMVARTTTAGSWHRVLSLLVLSLAPLLLTACSTSSTPGAPAAASPTNTRAGDVVLVDEVAAVTPPAGYTATTPRLLHDRPGEPVLVVVDYHPGNGVNTVASCLAVQAWTEAHVISAPAVIVTPDVPRGAGLIFTQQITSPAEIAALPRPVGATEPWPNCLSAAEAGLEGDGDGRFGFAVAGTSPHASWVYSQEDLRLLVTPGWIDSAARAATDASPR